MGGRTVCSLPSGLLWNISHPFCSVLPVWAWSCTSTLSPYFQVVSLSKKLQSECLPALFVLRRASHYNPSGLRQCPEDVLQGCWPQPAPAGWRTFCQPPRLLTGGGRISAQPHNLSVLMIKEGLGESNSQEPSKAIKPPQGAPEGWTAGKTWRTSTVLCKYIYRMELFLGPLGPFPKLCGRNCLPQNDWQDQWGQLSRPWFLSLHWHIYLMSRRNRTGEALKLGTAGGLEWKNYVLALWKNSILYLHIPVLLGSDPIGLAFPFVGQTGNPPWDLPRLGNVVWLL